MRLEYTWNKEIVFLPILKSVRKSLQSLLLKILSMSDILVKVEVRKGTIGTIIFLAMDKEYEMRFIEKEPTDEVYKKLIEYSVETCDAFMFVTCNYDENGDYKSNMDRYSEKFLPLMVKNRTNGKIITEWPGTQSAIRKQLSIMFFRCAPQLIDVLLMPEGLYRWRYPSFPEDLCFFRKGECWLTNCAHEQFSYIITKDDSEYKLLESMGIKFDEEEFEDKNFAFHEDY